MDYFIFRYYFIYLSMRGSQKLLLLITFTILTLIAVLLLRPIPQTLSFHQFADDRPLWKIPNFGNVISNLPFLFVGIYGMALAERKTVSLIIRIIYMLLVALYRDNTQRRSPPIYVGAILSDACHSVITLAVLPAGSNTRDPLSPMDRRIVRHRQSIGAT